MKNSQTLWDLLILLLIMCAGVASVKFLATNNRDKFDYRFPDKSLIAGAPSLNNNGRIDPNLGTVVLRDSWDYYYTPEEIYGMLYVQDYTCPMIDGVDMKLMVAGNLMTLNNDFEAIKKTSMRDAIKDMHTVDLNSFPDTRYYLKWDYNNRYWVVQYKEYEYNESTRGWEATR